MTSWSLRTRVAFATIGVLIVGLVVISVVFNVLLASRLSADASTVLRNRAAAERATLVVRDGRVQRDRARNDAALDHQAWIFQDGRLVEGPAAAFPYVRRAVDALAGVDRLTEQTIGDRIRLLAQPVGRPGAVGKATLIVGVPLAAYERTEHIALLGTIALCLFLLLAGVLAVRWSIRSALRPVAEMTRRAADWSERDLDRRFDLGPPRDELTGLASTFDGLLRRIAAVLRREQRFSAEMAHELRTPLTGVRAEAELALARTRDPVACEALERILAGTARMTTVIETLLNSERLAGGASAGSCDPVPAVREAVAGVAGAAAARGVELSVGAGSGAVMVDAATEVVAQALQPLLENAVRHARSRVEVDVVHSDGRVALAVVDDGLGLEQRDPESLFAPGVSTAGSAGLGLPLARRLARSCGGDVVSVPAAEGARFELRLPGGAQARAA